MVKEAGVTFEVVIIFASKGENVIDSAKPFLFHFRTFLRETSLRLIAPIPFTGAYSE